MKPRLHRNRVWAILSQIGTDGWFFRPKRVINYRNVLVLSCKLVTCDRPPPRKEKVYPEKFRPPSLGIGPEQSRSCVRPEDPLTSLKPMSWLNATLGLVVVGSLSRSRASPLRAEPI